MQPLTGLTVVTLEHAIAGAVRHPPARRPRRPRHQDRASRLRRLRPRLRRPRPRPGLALRLDQPLQGEPDARRQAPRRRQGAGTAGAGQGRRRGAEPGARRGRPARPRVRPAVRDEARDHRLRHLRLRRRRPLPRQEGLRPADPERGRLPSRSPARRTSRPRPDRRSPTSPPACTPTPTSSPRCCSARRPARASTSTSRCWSRWPSGPVYPLYYAFDGAPPPPRTGAATRPSTPTARSRPATAAR